VLFEFVAIKSADSLRYFTLTEEANKMAPDMRHLHGQGHGKFCINSMLEHLILIVK
jgi:hypothetical protein